MKRGGPLERRTPLRSISSRDVMGREGMRSSSLRYAWPEADQGAPLSRSTPLAPGKRKVRRKISERTAKIVAKRSGGRCIVCRRKGRMTRHHVLPVQKWPELQTLADNMVLACFDCHMAHENASRRIRWDELPACAITLAYSTSGAAAVYLEKTYVR